MTLLGPIPRVSLLIDAWLAAATARVLAPVSPPIASSVSEGGTITGPLSALGEVAGAVRVAVPPVYVRAMKEAAGME